jgi:hypothetical protein
MIPLTDLIYRYAFVIVAAVAYCLAVAAFVYGALPRLKGRLEIHGLKIVYSADRYMTLFVVFAHLTGALALAAAVMTIRFLSGAQPDSIRTIGGTAMLLVVAVLLFSLKVTYLRGYAVLEGAFAVASAHHVLSGLADTIQSMELLTLLGSAYLMIQGLDNFKQDMDERRGRTTALEVTPTLPVQ